MRKAICIDGPGAGGKSTLAVNLVEHLGLNPETQLIKGDWYFEKWGKDNAPEGVPTPGYFNAERFMEDFGEPFNNGGSPRVVEYIHRPEGRELTEHTSPDLDALIVVEGIKTIALPINWTHRIWVDTPRNVREQRFLDRSVDERRTNIDDRDYWWKAFQYWADDAERYETVLNPHEDEGILVVSGLIAADQQLRQIAAELGSE